MKWDSCGQVRLSSQRFRLDKESNGNQTRPSGVLVSDVRWCAAAVVKDEYES